MSDKLPIEHSKLIKSLAHFLDTIKMPRSKVATYKVVILKGKKKGCYDFICEELLEGYHELSYTNMRKRKNLTLLDKVGDYGL